MSAKIPYLSPQFYKCISHNEESNYLNFDKDYLSSHRNGFMCYFCIQDYKNYLKQTNKQIKTEQNIYPNENIVALKIILAQIFNNMSNMKQCFEVSANIEIKISEITEFISQHRTQFQNHEEVLNAWKKQAESIRNKAMTVYELKNQFQIIISSKLQPQQRQQLITQYILKNRQFLSTNSQDFQDYIKLDPGLRIFNYLYDYVAENLQQINKLHETQKLNDYNVMVLFSLNIVSGSLKYGFSQQLMGPCMSIVDNDKLEMKTSAQQRIAIMNPCLQKNNATKKWQIQIIKLASWIGVGVCHINKIKQANFNFNYSKTNHGSYFISSNGYSWSSYKPEYNSKYQSFSFTTGDVIKLEYNPKQSILRFEKVGTQSKYSLEIQKSNDKIHPAVNLTGVGDSIRIIN